MSDSAQVAESLTSEPDIGDKSDDSLSAGSRVDRSFGIVWHKSDVSHSSQASQSRRRRRWQAIKSLLRGHPPPSDPTINSFGWGPCYEVPSLPGRKGPTLGIHFADSKAKGEKYIALLTPDSMERYSLYGKLLQRTACAPFTATKVTFGHIVGMGKVVVCGTQCGKVVFYSLDRFERLHIFDTACSYRVDSKDSGVEVVDVMPAEHLYVPTYGYDITSLALVEAFDRFCRWLYIGNSMGHILHVQVPSFVVLNATEYPPKESQTSTCDVNVDVPEFYMKATACNIKLEPQKDSTFVSCFKIYTSQGQLWTGYGNGDIGIFTLYTGQCVKYISNNTANPKTSRFDTIITLIEFCSRLDAAILVFGNDRIDVWDSKQYKYLKSIPSSILACNSNAIATLCILDEDFDKSANLFIGCMDGSLLCRRIQRTDCGDITWTLLFDLAHKCNFGEPDTHDSSDFENNTTFDDDCDTNDDDVDFRGAPITCILPIIDYNCVLVGNACGGLLAAWNVLSKL